MKKTFLIGLAFMMGALASCGGTPTNPTTVTPTSEPTATVEPTSEVTTTSVEPTTTTVEPTSETTTSIDPTTIEPTTSLATTFTVQFFVDNQIYDSAIVNEGEQVARPADPVKQGFEFTNWYTSNSFIDVYDFDTPVTQNLNLYAGFDELVTVTFDLHGGSFEAETPLTRTIKKGMTITRPSSPVKDGYNFECWSKVADSKEDEFRFSTPIEEDMTLHAVWEEIVIKTLYNITGTSQAGLSYRVEMAADDDIETYWQAADKSAQTLLVDLGEVMNVSRVSQEFVNATTWDFKVVGSFDGENYYEILSNANAVNGTKFETSVSGYYRYLKLEVAADQAYEATSKEFHISYTSLEKGINVFYGYKGVGDNSWSGGNEYEKMFDGREDTMFCAGDGGPGHWYGASSKTHQYYTNEVEILFHDVDYHKFSLDISKNYGAEWPNLCDYKAGEVESRGYNFPVNDIISGVLVHYDGPRWANADELRAWGFKDLQITPASENGKQVYDMGNLGRVGVIRLSNKDAANIALEISADGVNYTPVELNNGETSFVKVNKDARFVRYSSDDTESSINVFGISYLTNLVLGKMLDADQATEPGYTIDMATMNKECEAGTTRFYCRHDGEEGQVRVDLGNNCYIENIYVKIQDPQTDNVRLRIETSKDGVSYTSHMDTYETPASGQDWNLDIKDTVRYIRVSIQFVAGWTNINTLAIFGYGNALL